jgi:hypothetical protein
MEQVAVLNEMVSVFRLPDHPREHHAGANLAAV